MAYPNVGGVKRWQHSALAVVCMTLFAPLAWANVDQGLLEKAEALLKASQYEEAYALLEPWEVAGAGDPVYDYLLGTAALESNRPSKASFVYERILAVTPDYIGVRADMGRAYLALGDYGRAKIEFESVLSIQNLPPDLRSAVEQYAKAAEARAQNKRTVASGYAELGVGADSNIGSATALDRVNLPSVGLYAPAPPTGQKTQDNYGTLGLGGEINHQLTDQWGLYAGADYRGRGFQQFADSDYATLDGRVGLSYSGGGWLLRGGLTAGQYMLNRSRLRDTLGATLDWRMALNSSSQFSLGASFGDAKYQLPIYSSQDTQTTTLSAGWLTSLGDGSAVFSLTGAYGIERAVGGRDDGDRRFYGPRLTLQKNFAEKLGAYVSVGATYSKYAGTNGLYLMSRDESLYDISLGMSLSMGRGLSVRPQFSASRNTSNAELYSYDKNDFSVNIRLDY
nr:surface lipoprotein assembly modifier [uncultured Rhodoferax sp.]